MLDLQEKVCLFVLFYESIPNESGAKSVTKENPIVKIVRGVEENARDMIFNFNSLLIRIKTSQIRAQGRDFL